MTQFHRHTTPHAKDGIFLIFANYLLLQLTIRPYIKASTNSQKAAKLNTTFQRMLLRRIVNICGAFARNVNIVAKPQFTAPTITSCRSMCVMTKPVIAQQCKSSSSVAVAIMKRSMITVSPSIVQKKVISPIPSSPMACVKRLSSTMKKRRMKMNKHKLKKRRKALRMNTKASREA